MNLEILVWLPAIVLLYYIPWACYYDLKYRELPAGFWMPLSVVCVPVTVILYLTGIYPWYLAVLSGGMTGFYYILYCMDLFEGADFIYLAAITLFLVQNPVSGHILVPLTFGIYLIASVVILALVYNIPQVKMRVAKENLPGLLTISLALILTVAMG